ncbi:hypothetical protein AB6A40_003718 [Gnathostoma spinigerum]|uniref:Beta-lactamase-related domain-containing protein n=1 Tax=Gnathostoma spinigerum TaxID=75299 RepID=A0ABD6EAD1_9BILA
MIPSSMFQEDRDDLKPEDELDEKEIANPSEFLNNKYYGSVKEALKMFENDALISMPGEKFNYTTHGFTLLSAVMEKAAGAPYTKLVERFFRSLDMNSSTVDKNAYIVPNRTRYYYRDSNHRLLNAPEVSNSYKWAGGGLLSNVGDVLKFANVLLYSFHASRTENDFTDPPPLLNRETLKMFWDDVVKAGNGGKEYALGWYRVGAEQGYGGMNSAQVRHGYWYHTGAAVGASSVLLIKPYMKGNRTDGVCIVILVNLHNCTGLTQLALDVGEIFS